MSRRVYLINWDIYGFFFPENVEIFHLQFLLTFVLQPYGIFTCGRKKMYIL